MLDAHDDCPNIYDFREWLEGMTGLTLEGMAEKPAYLFWLAGIQWERGGRKIAATHGEQITEVPATH